MKYATNSEKDTGSFNMAVLYYDELHGLRTLKSRAVISGDLYAYFDSLEQIYLSVSFMLTTNQQEKVEEQFQRVRQFLETDGPRGQQRQIKDLAMRHAKKIMNEIDKLLLELMYRAGMIFPKSESRGVEALLKRFKLDFKEDDNKQRPKNIREVNSEDTQN